jgi:putative transposase
MSRSRRHVKPYTAQHLISRFLDRRYFLADTHDRTEYLRCLGNAVRDWDWKIVSFALMSNHIHLGALAGEMPLGPTFKSLHVRYARSWHDRYGGLGPVIADRPANFEVPEVLVPRLIAYHHRNPVEAEVVEDPADSTWTSHRMYLGLDEAPSWLCIDKGLELCGFGDSRLGRSHFNEFVRTADLRETCIGPSLYVVEKVEGNESTFAGPRDKRALEKLATIAAKIAGQSEALVYQRQRPVSDARLLFIGAARRLGASNQSIADHLGLSRSAISDITRRNKDRFTELCLKSRLACAQLQHR